MKKHTQGIFEDIKKPRFKESYAAIGIQFEMYQMLSDARREKKMTQKELAKKIGMTQSSLARIESGRGNPSFGLIAKIAYFLDCSIRIIPK